MMALELPTGEFLEVTPEHRFYHNGEWIEARSLKAGDLLHLKNGDYTTIISIENFPKYQKVYNFDIADNENYYVAEDGILVHNGYKEAVDDVNSGKTPLEGYEGHKVGNHTRKSNYGEMNTDLKMESITEIDGKPASLTALHEKITDIDTPIKQGIDHIYQNATPPPKYVIVESKYGSSTLNPKTKDGPQMSDDWIKGNNRLDKIVGKEKALEIKEALDNGEVDRVLSKIDANGNVTTQKINSAGKIIGNWK